jgi:glycosyltransferase involved in cell wall biosynthesis
MSQPPISVVIATRDRTQSLLRCLASLSTVDHPSFDVVVVDSAPRTDDTADALAAQRDWPFMLRYRRVDRPGLAIAHNAALPLVTGELVAITDDDVEVDRNWLATIAAAFAEFDATCVTGLILPAELETPAQLLIEQAGGFSRGLTRRVFHRDMPPPDPLFPFTAGRFGSGANMAFRTGWLAARGGFDPATGAGSTARGGDDLSAFLQVILDGGTLVYEPAAIVRHWHHRDHAAVRRQAYGYGVGLGAYLAAAVWSRPALLGAMLHRSVPAARHLLGRGSVRNAGRAPDFPRELVWRELAGVLAGPFAYAISRWRCRGWAARR